MCEYKPEIDITNFDARAINFSKAGEINTDLEFRNSEHVYS